VKQEKEVQGVQLDVQDLKVDLACKDLEESLVLLVKLEHLGKRVHKVQLVHKV